MFGRLIRYDENASCKINALGIIVFLCMDWARRVNIHAALWHSHIVKLLSPDQPEHRGDKFHTFYINGCLEHNHSIYVLFAKEKYVRFRAWCEPESAF